MVTKRFHQETALTQQPTQSNVQRQRQTVSPEVSEANTILALQRTIGNQAVQRLLAGRANDSELDRITSDWATHSGGGTITHSAYLQAFVHPATFLGVQIQGGLHNDFLPLLRNAEQILGYSPATPGRHGIYHISGYQNTRFRGLHSWGLAVDINTATNPYIMHEGGEAQLDLQLDPVYHRIAWFILGRNSVIPNQIRHPETMQGTRQSRVNRLYELLSEESRAMRTYFCYMRNPEELRGYLQTPEGYRRYFIITRDVGEEEQSGGNIDIEALRRLMMRDFAVLTSRPGPAIQPSENEQVGASNSPPLPYPRPAALSGRQDRPFDHSRHPRRSPSYGFLDLEQQLVLALTQVGLCWGAIDLGNESGDIMHFDMGQQPLGQAITRAIRNVRSPHRVRAR